MTPIQEYKLKGAEAAARGVPLSSCPYHLSLGEITAWKEGHNEFMDKTTETREIMNAAVGKHSAAMWKVLTAMEESFRDDGVKDNR